MTKSQSIYKDISTRTDGEIFIGVTGPVRSGKSTFIRKFMESVVLPGIKSEKDRIRTADELPQSAGGRTVMTTEPKFIPDEAVEVTFGEGNTARVKLIDCVGYLIPDIIGDTENGQVRLVNTPWNDEPIPFAEAAETGTRKVIAEHSTVGIVVTSDGSVGEIPRENYVEAEGRTVRELQELGKPFVIVVNSAEPHTPEAEALALELEGKYAAPVALLNCQELDSSDAEEIMKLLITEFPIKEISITMPRWTVALDSDHPIRRSVTDMLRASLTDITRMSDV
ncbi:MAG: stage IV sporulation protein A, partial [Clostridia bacterium]|nr:stage IV sporulation protein A [Clostridia bacterium]